MLEKLEDATLNAIVTAGPFQGTSIICLLLDSNMAENFLKENAALFKTLLEKLEDTTLNAIRTDGKNKGTSIVFKMLTTEVGKACLKENPKLLNQLLEKLDGKTLDAETVDGQSIRSVLNIEKKLKENEKIQFEHFFITNNINKIEEEMNMAITEDIKKNSNTL